MGIEIERKFLVHKEKLFDIPAGTHIRQGYLSSSNETCVRIRVLQGNAYLTIKDSSNELSRLEFEYSIPSHDATYMLEHLCTQPIIEKTRVNILDNGRTWEVDIFEGDNQGLIIAEIELSHEEEVFKKPEWLAEEVTGDPRFYNINLVKHPYRLWRDDA